MNGSLKKILDLLLCNGARFCAGSGYIQILNFGLLQYRDFLTVVNSCKDLDTHAGYNCVLVEKI